MAANNLEPLSSESECLMENEADFPEVCQQWLLEESAKLDNEEKLKVISELYSSGILEKESIELKRMDGMLERVMEAAVTIACAKSDNMKGLLEALDNMDDPGLMSRLRNFVEEFPSQNELSEAMDDLSVGEPGTSGESSREAGMDPGNGAAQVGAGQAGAGQVGRLQDGNNPVEQILEINYKKL